MSKTEHAYNNSAEKYDSKFSSYEIYLKRITEFASSINKNSSVLDIGCGPGINAEIFTSHGHTVTGIDFSEKMITLAGERCPAGKFMVKNAADPDTDEKYDAICLSFIIVHLDDKETDGLIKKLSSIINPGGYVYISFMTGKAAGYEKTSFSDDEIFFNYYSPEKIEKLFAAEGFIKIKDFNEPYIEPDGSVTTDVFMIFQYR